MGEKLAALEAAVVAAVAKIQELGAKAVNPADLTKVDQLAAELNAAVAAATPPAV